MNPYPKNTNNNLTALNLRQFRPIPLIRNSERQDFKRCPAAWNWRWNMGLVPAMPKHDARWFGSCWHLVWAEMYTPPPGKDGFTRADKDPHEIWEEATRNIYTTVAGSPYFDEDGEKEFYDAVALGHSMINGQLKEYNLDPGWEVLMPEQRFRAKIPFNNRQRDLSAPLSYWIQLGHPRGSQSGGYIAEAVGTFDMPILDHTGGKPIPKIVDWKTTQRQTNLKQMNKDDQTGTYISVATGFLRSMGMIAKDMAVEYMIFSFARKAMPKDNVDDFGRVRNKPQKRHYLEALKSYGFFEKADDKLSLDQLKALAETSLSVPVYGDVSKNQGAPLFWREVVRRNKINRLRQISRIADDAEAMAVIRAGIAPILKSPADHCAWCDYNDLCDIDEDGGDTELFMKDVFKVEDPYADHCEGAINSKESVTAKHDTGVS